MVKSLPANAGVQEPWVQSLGWEGPPEEEVAAHSCILTCKNPMDRGACQATVHGVTKESDTTELLSTHRHAFSTRLASQCG